MNGPQAKLKKAIAAQAAMAEAMRATAGEVERERDEAAAAAAVKLAGTTGGDAEGSR